MGVLVLKSVSGLDVGGRVHLASTMRYSAGVKKQGNLCGKLISG
jgi:hypothetical protein